MNAGGSAGAPAAGGPLQSVLAAFTDGARSKGDLARMTGLRPDVVDAAVAHLVRMGRLAATELTTGCPTGGCGTCASGVEGVPGCGAPEPSPRRSGPALVQLTLVQLTSRP